MRNVPIRPREHYDFDDKSVIKLPAPYSTLCESGNKIDNQMASIIADLLSGSRICLQMKALISLMYFNALRITEALQVSCYDIDTLGRIYIKGAKKSHNKLVTCPYYTSYFIDCKTSGRNPFDNYNRFFVYREFRKIGLVMQFKDYQRCAVTHSLRFASIGNIHSDMLSYEEIARFVGHKHQKTTIHYGKKTRKR